MNTDDFELLDKINDLVPNYDKPNNILSLEKILNKRKYITRNDFHEALETAVKDGDINIVKKLFEMYKTYTGEEINIYIGNNMYLRFAVLYGHLDIVIYLINIYRCLYKLYDIVYDEFNRAIRCNKLAIVKYFLNMPDSHVYINIHDPHEYSFHQAIKYGNIDIVKYLLQISKKYSGRDIIYNEYAFELAHKNGHMNIAKFLIKYAFNSHINHINIYQECYISQWRYPTTYTIKNNYYFGSLGIYRKLTKLQLNKLIL